MCLGWHHVHAARQSCRLGARLCQCLCYGRGVLSCFGRGTEGWAPSLRWAQRGRLCWHLWVPLGKVLSLGHQKASSTEQRRLEIRVGALGRWLLFPLELRELGEPPCWCCQGKPSPFGLFWRFLSPQVLLLALSIPSELVPWTALAGVSHSHSCWCAGGFMLLRPQCRS